VEVEQVALQLIPLLYDAAVQEGEMVRFVDGLTPELGAFSAGVSLQLPGFGRPPSIYESDADPGAIRSYQEYYHRLDPKIPRMARSNLYQLEEITRDLSPEKMKHSEFYNDFVVSNDRALAPHYAAVIDTEEGRPVASFFVRNRRVGSPRPISDRGRRLVEILIPHVASARRVWASIREADALDQGLRSALDSMEMGVVLVDVSQRICWASRAAEAILASRDGLRLEGGEIRADSRSDNAHLQRQICDAIRMRTGAHLATGGVVSLSRPSGRRSLEVVVAPLGYDSTLRSVTPTGGALVFVLDPEAGLPDEQEVLRALYGFTPAEAYLARLLADDLSLSEAAARAGITVQTARHRLKSLFEKTNTHRQSSLVRLLVRGPASLALRSAPAIRPRNLL
jgi:DNA-binding CsgD family transcriptional regulator